MPSMLPKPTAVAISIFSNVDHPARSRGFTRELASDSTDALALLQIIAGFLKENTVPRPTGEGKQEGLQTLFIGAAAIPGNENDILFWGTLN